MVNSLDLKYIINKNTVAILPEYKLNNAKSQIIELNKIFFINETPFNVVKNSLIHYGGNIKGARESAIYHLGNVNLPPIMINREKCIYFYTTTSMPNIDNVWISVDHTQRIVKGDKSTGKNATSIILRNNFEISLNMKLKALHNNYLRGIQLKKAYDDIVTGDTLIPQYTEVTEIPSSKKNLIIREKASNNFIFTSVEIDG